MAAAVGRDLGAALTQTAEKPDTASPQRQVGSPTAGRVRTWAAPEPLETDLEAFVAISTALTMAQEVERLESHKSQEDRG